MIGKTMELGKESDRIFGGGVREHFLVVKGGGVWLSG